MLLCAFLQKKNWGLNFFREMDPDKNTWNFIDSKLGTFTQQTGILEGIANINPSPISSCILPFM
jgi:hypothetical protein